MGNRGNCVPGSRNSKCKCKREKVLACVSRMVAKMECSAGTGKR